LVLEEKEIKMAIKVFSPVNSEEETIPIKRDVECGFNKMLDCEYTVMYKDYFEAQGLQCVSMPLMKSSLHKYLNSQINKILSDKVLN
jgi:hypothetical protein